mmetsp:Transcript_6911/g.19564  ORF Transcript_6911/g.19564 Transcript_6911/m.19564 type:complete len:202 (-) Transcript_6911:154-759(-)
MAGVLNWITVILGTIPALMMGCVGGTGKIIPGHPMNKAMSYGFANVFGPFLGCPGTPLRLIIGLGEMFAGIGLLVGLWGDAFDAFGKDLSDLAKALIIVAGVVFFIVAAVAAMMHKYIDGSPGMPAGMAVISLIFTLLRVFFLGPDKIPNQIIATVLSVLVMIGVLIAMAINRTAGLHEDQVEEENKKLHAIMDGKEVEGA